MDTINLETEEDRKEIKVGSNLEPSVKERLIQLLHDYVEIFSWSYEDMPGLDTDIVVPKYFQNHTQKHHFKQLKSKSKWSKTSN